MGSLSMSLFFVACALLLISCEVSAVTDDPIASNDLENVIKGDELALSLKHIKAKKRHRGPETLLAIEFDHEHHQRFAILLDRHHKRVIIETIEDKRPRSQHFTVDTLNDDSVIKSLVLAINQVKPDADATLYLDCVNYGRVAMPKTIREMFVQMENPHLTLLREKKYPVEIEGSDGLRKLLIRNNCPSVPSKHHFKTHMNFDDFQEHDPNVQGYEPDRGDIPSLHIPDEGAILKALNDLIHTVNNLNRVVNDQHNTIDHMRRILEDCEVCKPRPPEIVRPSCATHPPSCFPGVQCHDTSGGPRCGSCPRGYIGNGYSCTPGKICADRPCFPGVSCEDTAQGARCGACPHGYDGNGEQCRKRSGCEFNPCHPGESIRHY